MKKSGTTKYYNTALNINCNKSNKLAKLSTLSCKWFFVNIGAPNNVGERVDLRGGT